jgi:plasmid stabilization system protein ParE
MRIVWTKRARGRFSEILDYIKLKFGDTARQSFVTRTKDFTRLLYEFPEIGTLEIPEKKLRGFQLTRQTRVFYRIKNDHIILLTFFDSRQDRKKTTAIGYATQHQI